MELRKANAALKIKWLKQELNTSNLSEKSNYIRYLGCLEFNLKSVSFLYTIRRKSFPSFEEVVLKHTTYISQNL